jgi:hypothetical protein
MSAYKCEERVIPSMLSIRGMSLTLYVDSAERPFPVDSFCSFENGGFKTGRSVDERYFGNLVYQNS